MSFPIDDYTPLGYLDFPAHTRNLTPRGVLRSDNIGFGWHYPAWPHMFGGTNEIFATTLRVSLDGALDLSDFDRVASPYHSRNLKSFDLTRGAATATAEWHVVGEHALRVTIDSKGARRVALLLTYYRHLEANGQWGETGLLGREADGCLVLQSWEDGDAFALWTSPAMTDHFVTGDETAARRWADDPAPSLAASARDAYMPPKGQKEAKLAATLGFDASPSLRVEAILARGKTADEAFARLKAARGSAKREHTRKRAADDAFWANAPALEGDWPEPWRRGLVYGLETVRMMVKPPVGIYKHVWDAMQIQAPRVALAETSMDALTLAWADPALAQDLMLGTFLDAPKPNVPCSREDGTFNMVAADGTICGTGPEWGFPWLVLDWLWRFSPDRHWLQQIYPALAAHLDWWYEQRRDVDGWLVHACAWEAGQDDAKRFNQTPFESASKSWSVRPVDLQAAYAHAAGVMAAFATTLDKASDATKWSARATDFTSLTDKLWAGTQFTDGNGAAGKSTPGGKDDNPMFQVPVALGIAAQARVATLTPALGVIDAGQLNWPPPTWTVLEAAKMADHFDAVAAAAGGVCGRGFSRWDARDATAEPLPGIASEQWIKSGSGVTEGYGWGSFIIHFLLHYLVGVSPTTDGLTLRPNLPPDLRIPGKSYTVRLTLHGTRRALTIAPQANGRVQVTVDGHVAEVAWGEDVPLAGAIAD